MLAQLELCSIRKRIPQRKMRQGGVDELKRQMFFSNGAISSCGVAIGYFRTKSFKLENIKSVKNGCLFLLDAKIVDQSFALLNIYNANIVKEQLSALIEHKNMLNNNFSNISSKQIILGGDLNFYFDSLLEVKGGNPVLRKKSVATTIEIKKVFDLCDIWRVRNRKSTRFTSRQMLKPILKKDLTFFCLKHTPRIYYKN